MQRLGLIPLGCLVVGGRDFKCLELLGTEITDLGQLRDCEKGSHIYLKIGDSQLRTLHYVEIQEDSMKSEETHLGTRIPKVNWEDYPLTIGDIIGVEMQNGKKYFLQLNDEGVVPVNLKKHENNDYSDTTDLESILTGSVNKLLGSKKVFSFRTMSDMISWATN